MNFKPTNYFDLTNFTQADIFEGVENIWEVLKKLSSYLNGIVIDPTAKVDPTAKILGPAIIGANTVIGFNALIRENVITGSDCIIGHGTEVKNSIILNNSFFSHMSYIGDSVIGNNINFGGGAKTGNLRLDKAPVTVKIGEEIIETGLEKFGAVVGDNTKIGINAVLNPGTILGKNCIVYPLVSVNGVFAENSKIK
ncbi:glucose-1-phosphate thymidylyltransferase [Candidatus Daviesbacteria bacterium]|nr:glucose-1-phosphate thymidylyltransferase [Candidatus Daviesbacteria bacterium]